MLCANKAILIYKHLRGKNMLIDLADIFIAATCLANNLEIVTLNRKHFKRIDGLRILENYK
ncbi:MAG: type II toxin-antitoxin system VapC family toxin [Ignavibacteriales bacterium]|nr:type II toxin-antitoxin system VapC family toxin [Ignavibacteriales bacterium]